MADVELPALVAGAWPRDLEIQLFDACAEQRPVGVDKHFRMVSILRHLRQWHPDITTKHIWDHLNTVYDLSALEDGVGGEKDDPSEREFPFNYLPKDQDNDDFALPGEGMFAERMVAIEREEEDEDDEQDAQEADKDAGNGDDAEADVKGEDAAAAAAGDDAEGAQEEAEEEAPPPKTTKEAKKLSKKVIKAAAKAAAAEAKAKAEAEAEAAAEAEGSEEEVASTRRSRSAGGKGGGDKSDGGSSPKKAKKEKEPKSSGRPKRKGR